MKTPRHIATQKLQMVFQCKIGVAFEMRHSWAWYHLKDKNAYNCGMWLSEMEKNSHSERRTATTAEGILPILPRQKRWKWDELRFSSSGIIYPPSRCFSFGKHIQGVSRLPFSAVLPAWAGRKVNNKKKNKRKRQQLLPSAHEDVIEVLQVYSWEIESRLAKCKPTKMWAPSLRRNYFRRLRRPPFPRPSTPTMSELHFAMSSALISYPLHSIIHTLSIKSVFHRTHIRRVFVLINGSFLHRTVFRFLWTGLLKIKILTRFLHGGEITGTPSWLWDESLQVASNTVDLLASLRGKRVNPGAWSEGSSCCVVVGPVESHQIDKKGYLVHIRQQNLTRNSYSGIIYTFRIFNVTYSPLGRKELSQFTRDNITGKASHNVKWERKRFKIQHLQTVCVVHWFVGHYRHPAVRTYSIILTFLNGVNSKRLVNHEQTDSSSEAWLTVCVWVLTAPPLHTFGHVVLSFGRCL